MIVAETVNATYGKLAAATEEYFSAGANYANTKTELDGAVKKGLADGTITGKNADMRDACAREIFSELFNRAEVAQLIESAAKLNLDLARIEVERVRMLVRIEELIKE